MYILHSYFVLEPNNSNACTECLIAIITHCYCDNLNKLKGNILSITAACCQAFPIQINP